MVIDNRPPLGFTRSMQTVKRGHMV